MMEDQVTQPEPVNSFENIDFRSPDGNKEIVMEQEDQEQVLSTTHNCDNNLSNQNYTNKTASTNKPTHFSSHVRLHIYTHDVI